MEPSCSPDPALSEVVAGLLSPTPIFCPGKIEEILTALPPPPPPAPPIALPDHYFTAAESSSKSSLFLPISATAPASCAASITAAVSNECSKFIGRLL